jgi:outer membrane protein assembly factor BamA
VKNLGQLLSYAHICLFLKMLLLSLFCSLWGFCPKTLPIDSFVVVQEIVLEGNKKTKDYIITRELDFAVGDTLYLHQLDKRLEFNRRKIMNTSLFHYASLTSEVDTSPKATIRIKLEEQWYILGYPDIQIADRNYNEWWSRGRRLDRLIFGAHIIHSNFRGRAEKLLMNLEVGFAQKIELFYRIPYIDKAQKTGIGFGVSFSTNKNVAFSTLRDTLAFIKSDDVLRRRFYAVASLKKRYHFYDNHTVELRYNNNWIADTIRIRNENYFLKNKNTQHYFQLSYYFNYDFRDNVVYPLRGYRYELYINKLGILPSDDLNQLDIVADYYRFWPINKRFFLSFNAEGKISFPQKQPFFNTRGLGYGVDLVRGYELFAIDGQKYIYGKNNLRYLLFDKKFHFKFIRSKQFNRVPVQLYPNIFFDAGYVANQYAAVNQSRFANTLLYGYGIGIDLVSYYNMVVKLHYAINRQNNSGFIFNITREF